MEHKAIIIYKSSTGFTKKYAELIAKETGFPLEDFRKVSAETLSPYQTVIFGGRLHAGCIDGWQKAKSMAQKAGARRIILFAVGGMPNTAAETISEMWKNNLSETELKQIPHFYMPGGLNYERMGFLDKAMMKAAAAVMSKRSDDETFKRMISRSYDISSEEFIVPLVELVREG